MDGREFSPDEAVREDLRIAGAPTHAQMSEPPQRDSTVNMDVEKTLKEDGIPNSNISAILSLVGDPLADLSQISRLIAIEIALVIQLMSVGEAATSRKQADLNNHVKALRELQKTLTEADSESKKDVLNMGGPKYQYVFGELLDLMKQAATNVGLDEGTKKQFLLQFRDLVTTEEDRIKREMNKL